MAVGDSGGIFAIGAAGDPPMVRYADRRRAGNRRPGWNSQVRMALGR
jgi:hypothetical protein